jgi:hypothetical protein
MTSFMAAYFAELDVHNREGDFAPAPQCAKLGDFDRSGGVGVSLPLVGRG